MYIYIHIYIYIYIYIYIGGQNRQLFRDRAVERSDEAHGRGHCARCRRNRRPCRRARPAISRPLGSRTCSVPALPLQVCVCVCVCVCVYI